MGKRFENPSAVILLLSRMKDGKEEILLQKRKNTGYYDGYYDFSASGHVEKNETMADAMCREAKEELGITINKNDLEFVCLVHKKDKDEPTYYMGTFKTKKWTGDLIINESKKIEELKWIDINNLPNNLIGDRYIAIENYKNGINYGEYGWANKEEI